MDRQTTLKTMPYKEYLKTPEWQAKRKEALIRDGNRCRNCSDTKDLNVHHSTYARRGNEDPNDLTTLCERCHKMFHENIKQEEILQRTEHIPLTEEEMEQRNKESRQRWEDYLIGLLLQDSQLLSHVHVIISEEDFEGEDTKALYCILLTLQIEKKDIKDYTIPDQLLPSVERIKSFEFFGHIKDGRALVKDAMQCAIRLKRRHLLQLRNEIKDLIDAAYKSGDIEAMREFLKKSSTINNSLRAIDGASK